MAGDYLVDGARIMAMRRARGLSRRVLADLVGCSEEWLRLVEKGVRPLDRLSTLMRIAGVLRVVDMSQLVGGPIALPAVSGPAGSGSAVSGSAMAGPGGHAGGHSGGADEMGLALLFPRRPAEGEAAAGVHRVRRHVTAAWEVWRRSPRRYTELRRDLPGLLVMADATAREPYRAQAQAGAGVELGRVYRLFATVLRGCGEHALALLAADRAVSAAPGDPSAAALARAETAEVLVRLGRPADARRVALAAADLAAEAPGPPGAGGTRTEDGSERRSAVGACLLAAALAAAAENDLLGAEELLNRARRLAGRLGEDRDDFLVELDLRAASAAVRVGRHRQALRLAEGIDPARLSTRDRRVRQLLTLATAHAGDRDPRAAAALLRKVAETCPEELKHGARAVRLLAELRLLDCATTQGELRELTRLTA
ncbi:helix-turn-helix transcriptional regulator [Nonomuraea sp. NPDC005501]|uniref:helix-turn-helix domain-containing protein n=1 Tax=Nonomuraea sp. NPDC005501 TaxID=3156884 RepID=UPI0033B35C5C